MYDIQLISVSQQKNKYLFFGSTRYTDTVWVNPPPKIFWHFSPNGWEFLVKILPPFYTFLSTLDYKFLFNYLQLWPKLCHIKRDHHNVLKMSTID